MLARKRRNMSQNQLARLLGIQASTMCEIERSRVNITKEDFQRMMGKLDSAEDKVTA